MKFDYSKMFFFLFLIFMCFNFFYVALDYVHINKNITSVCEKLASAHSEKFFLLKNIEKFVGPEIDQDLLESQARKILSLVPDNESIIFWKEKPGENLNVYYGRS